ncbi:MAG: hypothetical protein AAB431_01455 [Patescibacteria group bacterium]
MKDSNANASVSILAGIAAIVAIVAIVATVLYFNPQSEQETNNTTYQETTQTIPSAFSQRETSENELQLRLDTFSTGIDALRSDVNTSLSTMTADMKTAWNTTSAELDTRFNDAKNKLDALKKDSVEQSWIDLQVQTSSSLSGLEAAYLDAKATFMANK